MSMKVAVVDDDESVSRSIVRLLRLAGMDPTAFRSAQEFLASALRPSFDCLILDIYMEKSISGLELKQQLMDQGDRTPVIFFSAHDDAETQAEAARVGCEAFLRKGDDVNLLIETLRRIEAANLNKS